MARRDNFMSNAEIIENRVILENTGLRNMVLYAPDIAKRVKPGQLAHIKCGESFVLRRPFSIAGSDKETFRICYDIRGGGTKWMAEQPVGTKLSVLGPLGNGYTVYKDKKALLVGGGTGIYSLMSLSPIYGENAVVVIGCRNVGLLNSIADFEALGNCVSVITDDGSSGRKGLVTDLVREELEKGGIDIAYICGPTPMMAAAVKIVDEFGIDCQVSMEERMGCCVGACQVCVCKVVTDGEEDYKRVCIDGPVFNSKEIKW